MDEPLVPTNPIVRPEATVSPAVTAARARWLYDVVTGTPPTRP
nr:hypothetical protein [Haloactinopolyspora sp.]